MKNNKIIKNILLYIILTIIVSPKILLQELSNLDEMWVYNFARCILNGLLPYKDFSIIITPLFPMICAIFLKIFGDEMVVLRGLEVIQFALILFMIFKILKRLDVSTGTSIISVYRFI